MGYVRHIGRIGTLAVALGVGAAVTTTPAICSAAPDSGSSGARSSSTAGESSTNGASASPGGSSPSGASSLSHGSGADAPDAAPSSSASGDSPRKSVLRGANVPTVKARRSGGAGTSTAVGAADHPDTDGTIAAVEQQGSATAGERHAAPGEGGVTTAGATSAPITPASLSGPAPESSVTDSIDRLPLITAVTGGHKPAVRGPGPAVVDEISAASAELSTTAAPDAAAASQLSPASTAAASPLAR